MSRRPFYRDRYLYGFVTACVASGIFNQNIAGIWKFIAAWAVCTLGSSIAAYLGKDTDGGGR